MCVLGVACLFIALLAGEGVTAPVGGARYPLVHQRLAPRHVLQVLVAHSVGVGYPTGAAQVVAVLPIGGVVVAPMSLQLAQNCEPVGHDAVGRGGVHFRLLCCKRSGIGNMVVESSDIDVNIPLATKNLTMFFFSFHVANLQNLFHIANCLFHIGFRFCSLTSLFISARICLTEASTSLPLM